MSSADGGSLPPGTILLPWEPKGNPDDEALTVLGPAYGPDARGRRAAWGYRVVLPSGRIGTVGKESIGATYRVKEGAGRSAPVE